MKFDIRSFKCVEIIKRRLVGIEGRAQMLNVRGGRVFRSVPRQPDLEKGPRFLKMPFPFRLGQQRTSTSSESRRRRMSCICTRPSQ